MNFRMISVRNGAQARRCAMVPCPVRKESLLPIAIGMIFCLPRTRSFYAGVLFHQGKRKCKAAHSKNTLQK